MQKIAILGGGIAEITVAARLLRQAIKGEVSIVLIDPCTLTTIRSGVFPKERTRRWMTEVMPRGVDLVQPRAEGPPSKPQDYQGNDPHLLGTMRTGPDLFNIGQRQPSRD